MREYFERLGIDLRKHYGLSDNDLKTLVNGNYRVLVRMSHPDIVGEDRIQEFREVQKAYDEIITFPCPLSELVKEIQKKPKKRCQDSELREMTLRLCFKRRLLLELLKQKWQIIQADLQNFKAEFQTKDGNSYQPGQFISKFNSLELAQVDIDQNGSVVNFGTLKRLEVDYRRELVPSNIKTFMTRLVKRNSRLEVYLEPEQMLLPEPFDLRILGFATLIADDSDHAKKFVYDQMKVILARGISDYPGLDLDELILVIDDLDSVMDFDKVPLAVDLSSETPKIIPLGIVLRF